MEPRQQQWCGWCCLAGVGAWPQLSERKVMGWQCFDSSCSGRKQASKERETQWRSDEASWDSAANGEGRCRGRRKFREEGRALPWSLGMACGRVQQRARHGHGWCGGRARIALPGKASGGRGGGSGGRRKGGGRERLPGGSGCREREPTDRQVWPRKTNI
jgi:hypothetical protein